MYGTPQRTMLGTRHLNVSTSPRHQERIVRQISNYQPSSHFPPLTLVYGGRVGIFSPSSHSNTGEGPAITVFTLLDVQYSHSGSLTMISLRSDL